MKKIVVLLWALIFVSAGSVNAAKAEIEALNIGNIINISCEPWNVVNISFREKDGTTEKGSWHGRISGDVPRFPAYYPGTVSTESSVLLVKQSAINPASVLMLIDNSGATNYTNYIHLPSCTNDSVGEEYYFGRTNAGQGWSAYHARDNNGNPLTVEQALTPEHLAQQAPDVFPQQQRVKVRDSFVTYINPRHIREVFPAGSDWKIHVTMPAGGGWVKVEVHQTFPFPNFMDPQNQRHEEAIKPNMFMFLDDVRGLKIETLFGYNEAYLEQSFWVFLPGGKFYLTGQDRNPPPYGD